MRNERGITLIALVITIIVLLILAGISIAMLTGENGILTNAQNAKSQNAYAEAEEQMSLAYMAVRAEIAAQMASNTSYTALTDTTNLLSVVNADLTGKGWSTEVVTTKDETDNTESLQEIVIYVLDPAYLDKDEEKIFKEIDKSILLEPSLVQFGHNEDTIGDKSVEFNSTDRYFVEDFGGSYWSLLIKYFNDCESN